MPRKSKLTITEAIKYAKELGVFISRPTIIKYAIENKYGYQLGKGGKWIIKKEQFRGFICGQNKKHKKEEVLG